MREKETDWGEEEGVKPNVHSAEEIFGFRRQKELQIACLVFEWTNNDLIKLVIGE